MIKNLTWYQTLQYLSLLLLAVTIPIGWRYALWTSILLAITSLLSLRITYLKLNAQHSTLNANHLIILYWLLLLASMLYSDDSTTGWEILKIKAGMLIFPLAFLLTDRRWITSRLLRGVGYAFLASMTAVFIYHTSHAVGRILGGSTFGAAFGPSFDPRHHAYTALYLAVVLAFVYHELHAHWSELPSWHRGLMFAVVPLMILYMIIVNSRAGLLTLYLLEAACTIHFALTRRRWWKAVLMVLLLAGFTFGAEKALPGHQARVAATIEDMASDQPSDARVQINGSSTEAAFRHPLFGYGVGDYRHCLVDQYNANDFSAGVSAEYNAHNQYIETLLAVGLVGMIPFLGMLLLPLWSAWRRRIGALWLVAMLTGIICFNLLFESMLERQMGLLFITPLIVIMALIVSREKNKFCSKGKS